MRVRTSTRRTRTFSRSSFLAFSAAAAATSSSMRRRGRKRTEGNERFGRLPTGTALGSSPILLRKERSVNGWCESDLNERAKLIFIERNVRFETFRFSSLGQCRSWHRDSYRSDWSSVVPVSPLEEEEDRRTVCR